jgi:hypothetical protein
MHYTIFPKHLIKGIAYEIKEINFLPKYFVNANVQNKPRLRILIGTGHSIEPHGKFRDEIMQAGRFDLYLPHPSYYGRLPKASDRILSILSLEEMSVLIAEDVIKKLLEAGEQLVVYGYGSTTLLIIAQQVRVVNIAIEGSDEVLSDHLCSYFRIKQLKFRNHRASST